MSGQDQTPPAPRKPWTRIPPGVRLKLKRAIAEHLRTTRGARARDYHLLREHPEFSPYIGAHLGETGNKRLDRLISEVRGAAPSTRRKPTVAPSEATSADPGQTTTQPLSPAVVTSSEMLADVRPVLVGYDQLQGLVQRRLPELEAAIGALRNELGEILDVRLYVKLLQEQRATIDMVAKLTDRFQAQLKSSRFVSGMMRILKREFAEEPERLAAIENEISVLAADCGGLAPTTGATE